MRSGGTLHAQRRCRRQCESGDQRVLEGPEYRRDAGAYRVAPGRLLREAGRDRQAVCPQGVQDLRGRQAADPQMAGAGRAGSLHHGGSGRFQRYHADARQPGWGCVGALCR